MEMMSAMDSDKVEYFTKLNKVDVLVTELTELCNLRLAELMDMVSFVNTKNAHIDAFVKSQEPVTQVYLTAHQLSFREWLFDSFLEMSLAGKDNACVRGSNETLTRRSLLVGTEGDGGNDVGVGETIDISVDDNGDDMEEYNVEKNFARRGKADEDDNVSVKKRKIVTVEKGRNGGTVDGRLSSTQITDSSAAAELLVPEGSEKVPAVVNVRTVLQEGETTSIPTKSQTYVDSDSDDGHPPPVAGWKPKLSDVKVRYANEMRGYNKALNNYKSFKKNGIRKKKPKKPKSIEERMMSREELRAFRAQQAKDSTESVTTGSGSDSDEEK